MLELGGVAVPIAFRDGPLGSFASSGWKAALDFETVLHSGTKGTAASIALNGQTAIWSHREAETIYGQVVVLVCGFGDAAHRHLEMVRHCSTS